MLTRIDNLGWLSRGPISNSRLLGSLCRCLSSRATLATWSCFRFYLEPKYLFSQNNIVVNHNVSLDLFRDILIYAYNINHRKHNAFNVYNYLDSHSIAIYIHNSIAISSIVCLIHIITLNGFALIRMFDASNIKCISLIYTLYFHKKWKSFFSLSMKIFTYEHSFAWVKNLLYFSTSFTINEKILFFFVY